MFLTKEAVRLALDGVAVGVACDGCPLGRTDIAWASMVLHHVGWRDSRRYAGARKEVQLINDTGQRGDRPPRRWTEASWR
ncbi:MAG TPA: hypothetical protein VK988_14085 [Acidimicrobiales bacterium]|nr:hypothetical protein [Acidimicrobiales bacterium]